MDVSEKGMEELLTQKIVLLQAKKIIPLVQLKKLSEELNTGISSKYLINTQLLIAKWLVLRIARTLDIFETLFIIS